MPKRSRDTKTPAPRRLTERQLLARLVRDHMRPQWPKIALAFGCMTLVALTAGAMAQIMEPVIDSVFTDKDGAMLWPIALGVLAIFVVRGLATYAQAVLMNDVGRRIIADLQIAMFARKVHGDLAGFHDVSSGKLISRFTHDVGSLNGAVSNGITGIGKDILSLIVLVAVMFHLDWELAAITAVIFPLAVYPVEQIGRRIRRITKATQTQYGSLTGQLSQVFQGIRHVKAYNGEQRETLRLRRIVDELSRLAQRGARARSATIPIMEVLSGFAIVAVILYGGSEVISGERTTGSFFAFITALLLAYEPAKRLANLHGVLVQGLTAADRVFAMIDAQPTIGDAPDAVTLDRATGRIELRDVHFAYGRGIPALRGLSIEVPAGSTVALVGPSGAGKSTVLNLIPRFYDPTRGAVLIDGRDLRSVTLHSLRDQIGLVSQEVTLFDETVRANIAYGRPGASEGEIEAAAQAAAAHDFIRDLPKGYDTQVGEQGVKLSGGQRQRLSIARAMLKDAPILLLDEATSALDTESERQVQDALARLKAGRTTLMIAHRLSTVRDADLIYVLDQGRVVETGSHAALIARGGLYARLWAMQTAESGSVVPLAAGAGR